jgi:hypothetical protein
MAKNIGHILSMIFMPSTPGDFLACLLDQGVIDNKEEDRLGFDSQGIEELVQGGLENLFHGPDVLPQEPGETGEGSVKKGTGKGLNHRRSVDFFAQLNEAHNEG